jgi:hypothetical protein
MARNKVLGLIPKGTGCKTKKTHKLAQKTIHSAAAKVRKAVGNLGLFFF